MSNPKNESLNECLGFLFSHENKWSEGASIQVEGRHLGLKVIFSDGSDYFEGFGSYDSCQDFNAPFSNAAIAALKLMKKSYVSLKQTADSDLQDKIKRTIQDIDYLVKKLKSR